MGAASRLRRPPPYARAHGRPGASPPGALPRPTHARGAVSAPIPLGATRPVLTPTRTDRPGRPSPPVGGRPRAGQASTAPQVGRERRNGPTGPSPGPLRREPGTDSPPTPAPVSAGGPDRSQTRHSRCDGSGHQVSAARGAGRCAAGTRSPRGARAADDTPPAPIAHQRAGPEPAADRPAQGATRTASRARHRRPPEQGRAPPMADRPTPHPGQASKANSAPVTASMAQAFEKVSR